MLALREGRDAFAARALLADAAKRSIDARYYIWHQDVTGTLLLDALRRAADRGVRVRLLLDDNDTPGMDASLAALDAHPNIDVRLFNPFARRRWRYLDYILDFRRLNRRMHNKSFTVDGDATIVGGRNIGDEYFGTGTNPLFIDLDVLAVGPVVAEVSRDFERYWTSPSAHPVGQVLGKAARRKTETGVMESVHAPRESLAAEYLQAVAGSPFGRDMRAGKLAFDWVPVRMVSDDPSKGLGRAARHQMMWQRLKQITQWPEQEMQLVSPYFVPGQEGTKYIAGRARAGACMTVVTNSLEATDVVAVHAGYAKRRNRLLRAGVKLYEMKRAVAGPPVRGRRGGRASSASSLHAKTFQIDRNCVFVGSFNFDPRSQRLNTEMGLLIESREIAGTVAANIEKLAVARCYEVRLTPEGRLQWRDGDGPSDAVHDEEPGAGLWRSIAVRVLSWLPIEWLL